MSSFAVDTSYVPKTQKKNNNKISQIEFAKAQVIFEKKKVFLHSFFRLLIDLIRTLLI